MRIVEVHPGKKRRVAVFSEPRERAIDHLAPTPLDGVHAGRLGFRHVEIVEEQIEALSDAPASVQHERRDESARSIAACLERFGKSDVILLEVEPTVVADAVVGRPGAGQER